MDSFFDEFENYAQLQNMQFSKTDNRVRCLAHIVNLSCQAILQKAYPASFAEAADTDINLSEDEAAGDTDVSLLSKLRKGIIKICSSPQLFNAQCEAAGINPKALIRDV